jgi:hypothetical protein
MSTLPDEQVSAMRTMLVAHARHDINTAPSRRLGRGVAAGSLVIAGAVGGFGVAVAGGSVLTLQDSTQQHQVKPVSYYAAQIPELARAQQSSDVLPAAAGIDTSGFVPNSVRYVGEHEGVMYYLALSGTAQNVNSIDLLVVPVSDPGNFVIGGSSGLPFTVQTHGHGTATVPGSGHAAPAGSVQISHSVFVNPTEQAPTN